MAGEKKTLQVQIKQGRFTVINPKALDAFIVRSQAFSTLPGAAPGGLPTRSTREHRKEIIQLKIDFGFDQPMPSQITMDKRKGQIQYFTKLYKKYPKPVPPKLAIQALKGNKHTFFGGAGQALRALGEGDEPGTMELLEQYAFHDDVHEAAVALYKKGAYDVLARRFDELDNSVQNRVAMEFNQHCRKEKQIVEQTLPLLWRGLEAKEKGVASRFLEVAVEFTRADSPHYAKLKPYIEKADPKFAERIARAEKGRIDRRIREADADDIIDLLKTQSDPEIIKRSIQRSYRLGDKREMFAQKLGQLLAGMADHAQRDRIYTQLVPLLKRVPRQHIVIMLAESSRSKDNKFSDRVKDDRLALGAVDKAFFLEMLKTKPQALKKAHEQYIKTLSSTVRDKKIPDRLWVAQAVDILEPGDARQNMIKQLGWSLPYHVPVPDILRAMQKVKDPAVRRHVYNAMAFPLKKAGKTDQIKALIAAEPDKELRQMLQR